MIAAADAVKPLPTDFASPEITAHTSCVTRAAPAISGLVLFSARHAAAIDSWGSIGGDGGRGWMEKRHMAE